MKVTTITLAALMASVGFSIAQDAPGGNPPPPGGPGRPVPPLFAALDANKDGVIDADEIAKAPEALKSLDKNGDGKLTRDELMPARGEGRGERRGGGPGARRGGNQ
ncbi:EF-hand domain-containing protein [Verrucomicrobiota bacterium sgz303538]